MTNCFGRGTGIDNCGPSYLLFNATNCNVALGSNAAIDDLPSAGDFTLDGWVLPSSYGGGNNGRIADKSSWYVMISNALGLYVFADYDVTDAVSVSGLDDFSADGEWHHIAVVWDSGAKTFSLYIDGTEVSYTTQTAGANNYVTDAADDLYFGNEMTGAEYWDGLIGWLRISNTQRWTANFTAPVRCTLPAVDSDTLVLEIYEGNGTTTYNLAADHSNGVITGALWGCDCSIEDDPTCSNEVYVANKSNFANITDVYWYDASAAAFSSNLQSQTLPQILLPPVPAQNDIVYFGCNTALLDSGPFSSLVFDIGTAQVDLNTLVWQYWDGGAWTGLASIQDNTDAGGALSGEPFDTTGVNSVHWRLPSDWAATAVNGVTGYWVRVLLNAAVGANPAPPTQQNRHVYTVTWPHINIDADQLYGDLPTYLKINVENPSSSSATPSPRQVTRVLASSRNTARGQDFTPYINLSDEQNNSGITIAVSGTAAFANYINAPSGRAVQETPGAALTTFGTATLTDAISDQYVGRFRVFVRSMPSASLTAGDYTMRLQLILGEIEVWTSEEIDNKNTDELYFDFGQINIPANYGSDLVFDNVQIILQGRDNVAGAWTVYHLDLILWPVDEWSGDFFVEEEPTVDTSAAKIDYLRRLEINSVENQKRKIQALCRIVSTGEIVGVYAPIANDPASLGINKDTRIFFQTASYDSTSEAWVYDIEQVSRVQVFKIQRYLSMRGDR